MMNRAVKTPSGTMLLLLIRPLADLTAARAFRRIEESEDSTNTQQW